jgi:hypothetical protein
MARKKVAALLVDVLVDAGVERAYGIWSLEFPRASGVCGMVGKLIIGKNSAWNMSPQPCSRPRYCTQIPSKEIGGGCQETHPDRLFEQCSHYCELVSDPRTDASCPGNRYSDYNLAPRRLCNRSFDEVDQILARQRSFF